MGKHLEIKQASDRTEVVTSSVIDKLYNLAYENQELGILSQLDDSSELQGRLESQAAYEDAVLYLRAKFPNLTITVPNNNYYLRFQDPVIAQIFNTEYGDGTGTTQAQLTAVTNLNGRFGANTYTDFVEADSYDDMQYLKGIVNPVGFLSFYRLDDSYYTDTASYDSNVKLLKKQSFTAPPNTFIWTSGGDDKAFVRGNVWNRKVEFNHIDISNTSFICTNSSAQPVAFCYVDIPFENVSFPVYTEQSVAFFWGNGTLGKFIYPEGVTQTKDNFRACNVNYIEFPSTLQNLGLLFHEFRRDAPNVNNGSGCVVFKSVTPPTNVPASSVSPSYYCKFPGVIYCPSGSVSAYQTWAENYTYSNGVKLSDSVIIKSMAEMSQGEREMGTVTQEDIDRV